MSITREHIDALGTACRVASDGWDHTNVPLDMVLRSLIIVSQMSDDDVLTAGIAARRAARQRLGEHAEREFRLREAGQ